MRPAWWSRDHAPRAVLLSLAATPGPLPAVTAARLAGGREPADLLRPHSPDPAHVAERLAASSTRFLVPGDRGWPLLASPPDPPCAWLFAAGADPPPATGAVAVVGSRRASPLRRAVARSLAAGLAAAGCGVVSGGAVGVDAAAHAGALAAGGHTVAVLGCGLDVAYPRPNADLLRSIPEAGGTLLSEHPPGAPPRAANFPIRNRIIAALAAVVVVVEASARSGSLVTARAAGSRGGGRVMAVPGPPWDERSAGCNDLIRDGATLVRGLADVLDELALQPAPGRRPAGPAPATPGSPPLTGQARALLDLLVDGQVAPLSRLRAGSRLDVGAFGAALLDLELAGLVARTAGGVQVIALNPRGP